jgi:hypothetical protein
MTANTLALGLQEGRVGCMLARSVSSGLHKPMTANTLAPGLQEGRVGCMLARSVSSGREKLPENP